MDPVMIQPGQGRRTPTGAEPVPAQTPAATARQPQRFSGEVVYLFAFDIAYDMTRLTLTHLLGQPLAQFAVDRARQGPSQMFFYRPQMVRLPALERIGPFGAQRIERTVKLFPVGALGVSLRTRFVDKTLEELASYHNLQLSTGPIEAEARELAEQARRELAAFCIRPVSQLVDSELYTVFALRPPVAVDGGERFDSQRWLEQNRRSVAALLTQEPDGSILSEQEAMESTERSLSYYTSDLAVIDWDAALLIDEPRHFDETLHVMELANVQLVELQAYDRLLDAALGRSYRDLGARRPGRRRELLQDLREIRLDLARLSDELSNITKFFGDWHLARMYRVVGARFHLDGWQKSIDDKLRTLDDMYQLLNHERTNRIMIVLEAGIVLLFILDLVMLFFGLGVH